MTFKIEAEVDVSTDDISKISGYFESLVVDGLKTIAEATKKQERLVSFKVSTELITVNYGANTKSGS